MTRIDFYILPGDDPHARRLTACKLIEKAYRRGHTVYLKTDTEEEARQFDDLLWTFRQGSFIPHELAGLPELEAPVIIGYLPPPEGMREVMVNMGSSVPEGYNRFARVAEFIDEDEAVKLKGRVRYKIYKDNGCQIQTHDMKNSDGAKHAYD